jgi:predicted aldo/keto reductase-like oxidoreductase
VPKATRRELMGGTVAGIALHGCSKSSTDPTSGAARARASAPAASSGAATAPSTAAVPKRTLGKTGQQVSMLGLGGAHMGRQKDEQESIRIVRYALDNGITFLDNCWDYNQGRSEERMGKALADGYRQKAFLMTKLDGRNKDAAAKQLEQSLTRLRTDVIDLVQMHEIIRMEDPTNIFAEGGAIEALVEAKKAGKLRYIGFTGHKDPDIHLHMLNVAKEHGFAFDTVQMPLNVMDHHYRSFEKLVLPVLVEQNVGVLGMKSMGSGEILKSGVVSAPECLRYALSLPTSVVITGCESIENVDQALSVARSFKPLGAEELTALLERTKPAAVAGKYELFKTASKFDGTAQNPHWLEHAAL